MMCVTCSLLAFSAFIIVLAGTLKDPCQLGAAKLDGVQKTAHSDIKTAADNGMGAKKHLEGCLDYKTPITNTIVAGKGAVTACSTNKDPSACCKAQVDDFTKKVRFIVTTTQQCISTRY